MANEYNLNVHHMQSSGVMCQYITFIYLCLVTEKNHYTIRPMGCSHLNTRTGELIYTLKLKLSIFICRHWGNPK